MLICYVYGISFNKKKIELMLEKETTRGETVFYSSNLAFHQTL